MLVKLAGAVFVVGSFVFLGLAVLQKYRNAVRFWEDVLSFTVLCESEIFYRKEEFYKIIDNFRLSGRKYADIIGDVCQYNTKNRNLTEKENEFLLRFSEELLKIDTETQKKWFQEKKRESEDNRKKAKEEEDKKGKTIQKLLPFIGLGIVIFFI